MHNLQKEKKSPSLVLIYENKNDQIKLKSNKFLIKTLVPGEEAIWEKIIKVHFHDGIEFSELHNYDYRDERVLFLQHVNTGRKIGTVYAGYKPEYGRDTGLIRMLAYNEYLDDEGIIVLLANAIKKIAEDGRPKAVIELLDFHLTNIRCSIDIGFKPLIIDENQRERWRSVLEILQIDPVRFSNELHDPLFQFVHQKENADNPERTNLRARWYKNRDHRDVGGSIDALADEHLYHSAGLGEATTSIQSISAGSQSNLQLSYKCGEKKLCSGSTVLFAMRGQQTLDVNFQCEEPGTPGYFTVSKHPYTQLRAITDPSNVQLGFYIESGELYQDDVVTIDIHSFKWTPIADRYEFKVIIDDGNDLLSKRLPYPCVIEVNAGKAIRLEATVQMTRKSYEPIKLHVTARDQFDNRADLNGSATAIVCQSEHLIEMKHGLADAVIPCNEAIPVQVVVNCTEFSAISNACVISENLQAYVGDLHCHDFNSEAWGYPEELYRWAKEERNLDFLSVSVQSHGFIDNDKWVMNKYFTERYLNEGHFVTLLANEWQHSGYGDKIIHFLNGDQPYVCSTDSRYNSAAKLYEAVRNTDAVIISHHLAYPNGAWCPATTFEDIETDVDRLLEIWSMHGSSEGFDQSDRPLQNHTEKNTAMRALKSGLRVGFTAGSDTHSGRPGGSVKEPLGYWGGLVGVWAKSLTRTDIFNAIKARRTYALTGARIVLRMRVNEAEMGSEIPFSEDVAIRIDVQAPSKIQKIQLIKNAELHSEQFITDKKYSLGISDRIERCTFYHCRVILEDGNLAVCSPVWIG